MADWKPRPAGRTSVSTTPVASLGPWLVAVTVKVTTSPTEGMASSTVFWTATSAAAAAFSGAEAESLPVSGSGSVCAVLVAMLVIVPACVTTAWMTSPARPPLSSWPTSHCPVDSRYAPCEGDADNSARPAGRTSVTTTPLARFGPLFETLTNRVTVSPTRAEAGSTPFDTATSARVSTRVCAVAVLFVAFGSCVLLDTLAVSTIGLGVV